MSLRQIIEQSGGRIEMIDATPKWKGGEEMTLLVIVTKDGKKVSEPMTPNDAFAFVLDHQGQSYEYAMKYGGYSLEKVKTEK